MRYFLISDSRDTLVGMRLAGIEGVLAEGRDEVRAAVTDATGSGDVGILLISEKCAALCPELISELRLRLTTPLIVEIPNRHGTGRAPDSITRYIRESIGVKL